MAKHDGLGNGEPWLSRCGRYGFSVDVEVDGSIVMANKRNMVQVSEMVYGEVNVSPPLATIMWFSASSPMVQATMSRSISGSGFPLMHTKVSSVPQA